MLLRRCFQWSLFSLWLWPSCALSGPTLTVLHSFSGPDGSNPAAITVGANGVLYGITSYGGGHGLGTVYTLSQPTAGGSWDLTTIWNFGGLGDGANPTAALVLGEDGVLYGTTSEGGQYDDGTFFSLSPPAAGGGAWTEAVLWNFGGSGDASYPGAITSGNGGLFNGVSLYGGASNLGTVFSLTPPVSPGNAWTENVLYSFRGGIDGANPWFGALAISRRGVLYGTTAVGGNWASGTVFSLSPPSSTGGTWSETVLHSFRAGEDGDFPGGGVIVGHDDELYGTTTQGGLGGGGTVYLLTPPASPGAPWVESIIHRFLPQDGIFIRGYEPWCTLFQTRTGAIYGTTFSGGTSANNSSTGCGTIFALKPPAGPGCRWKGRILHDFGCGDGSLSRFGLVKGSDGAFYGTALNGGPGVVGTVFSLEF
jgi:uncharacterized repeat protein (TIGR03803 family)